MKRDLILMTGFALGLGLATSAFAGPDLKPNFNTTTGTVKVTNIGDADAALSHVTVICNAQGGGACPDPAPADVAPYTNPAFPNAVTILVPGQPAGQQHNHVIAFYDDLVFAPGSYTFTVCADAGADVAEDDEGNNCIRVNKKVRGKLTGPGGLTSNSPTK